MTGAVSSQKVTEECKGSLSVVGHHTKSAKVYGSLTARTRIQADVKAGLSDPALPSGRGVAQPIKGTPGITG